MKSIKPGRATSAMGAFGSAFAIVFGIGWTILAFSLTRKSEVPVVGVIFPLFGVLFVIVGFANLVFSLRNTVAPNRNSILDVVDSSEEPDPLNATFSRSVAPETPPAKSMERRLTELEGLKSSGAISQEEYQLTRKRILNEI